MTDRQPPKAIRLLVIDFTPAGDGTATGELKSSLFRGLADVPIMQISASGETFEYAYPNETRTLIRPSCFEDLLVQIDWFAPTIILARPTPDKEALWLLSMALQHRYGVPALVWIMDDWLSVMAPGPAQSSFEASLGAVLHAAGSGLSICDEMSAALGSRFRVPFTAVANGIDADGEFARFKPRHSDPEEPFVIRYAGALAHNMGVETLEQVAHAVRRLRQDGIDICFEIKTRGFWLETQGARFSDMEGVQASESDMGRAAYLSWLSEADCNLICYNFNDTSHRYVRYSLANKLPELLGVGAPVLAIGPADLPTLARIRTLGAGLHLSNPSSEAITRCLRDVATHRHRLFGVAAKGRQVAETHFALPDMQAALRSALQKILEDYAEGSASHHGALEQAMAGHDASLLPIPLSAIAKRTALVAGAARVERPQHASASNATKAHDASDAPPPRPTRQTSGLSSHFSDMRLSDEERSPKRDLGGVEPAQQAKGFPMTLDRASWGAAPWLAELVDKSAAFSETARKTTGQVAMAKAEGSAASTAPPEEHLVDARHADFQAINGASVRVGENGRFTVERRGAPAGDHAEITPNLDGALKGFRLDVIAARGKIDITCDGDILLTVKRAGAYDVTFRRPRQLKRIAIRCLESTEARLAVESIRFREKAPAGPPPTT